VNRFASAIVLLSLVLTARPAKAQIVNIQPLLGHGQQDGHLVEFSGAVEHRTGNLDLFFGKAGLLASYVANRHRVISSSSYELGIKNDAEYVHAAFSHLRYQYYATKLFAWETWVQGASNRFKRLSFRGLAGTGPRLEFFGQGPFRLSMGVHYMFELEELRSSPDATDALEEASHRSNSYLSFSWDLLANLVLTETLYFQPRLNAPATDFRLANEVHVTAKVTRHFGLGTTFQVAYDSQPPEAVTRLDTALFASVTISL
jgi:putative salt-induced outer membrane protein YdiY